MMVVVNWVSLSREERIVTSTTSNLGILNPAIYAMQYAYK
jgi:hypothetical protein